MSKSKPQLPGTSRVVRFYNTPYEGAMERVEAERDLMFGAIRRAWASPSVEETARRIGATAHESAKSFDEVLFWFWEQLCNHGSGSIWMNDGDRLALKAD